MSKRNGAVTVVSVLTCGVTYFFGVVDSFFDMFNNLLIDAEKTAKQFAIKNIATRACLLARVCMAQVLYIPLRNEKNHSKLNI